MNQNKTTKPASQTGRYFKYAIGEIVLVVIGILMALQINNWNEGRKLSNKESFYLKALKVDLIQSNIALERVIKKTYRVSNKLDKLVSLIKKNGNDLSVVQIDTLISESAGFTIVMPSEGVINDIISSGKLDMISNKVLREKIASWEADLKMIREFENLGKDMSTKYSEHISQYFDLANGKFNEPTFLIDKRNQFLNDHIMTNFMIKLFGNSMVRKDLYEEKTKEINTLIGIIDQELE